MDQNLMSEIEPALNRLHTQINQNPIFREIVHDLATILLKLSEGAPAAESATATQIASDEPANSAHKELISKEIAHHELNGRSEFKQSTSSGSATLPKAEPQKNANGLQETLAFSTPRTARPSNTRLIAIPDVPVPDDNLATMAARMKLKAEGARWAAERERLLQEGADYHQVIEPKDREIIFRARTTPDCFLWMCHRDGPKTADLAQYELLANCFDSAAETITLIDKLDESNENPAFLERGLNLAAEAQSALRVVVSNLDPNFPNYTDPDQFRLFGWLRNTCKDRQILIQRYMRLDDPADPSQWATICERLAAIREESDTMRTRDKRQRTLLNKLKYHLKLIQQNPGRNREQDWNASVDVVEELVSSGLPPSSIEIREALLPTVENMPDLEKLDNAKNFQIVLREVDRFLAATSSKREEEVTTVHSHEVQRVAELLQGKTVVLIGGDRRQAAADALKFAFSLKELIWVEGRDQTYVEFEPHVARDDVSLVILAIRWSRHGFGEVKNFCDHYDKPLIRLPGGYNPNQVAFHVLNQVADRLSKERDLVGVG